MTERHWVLTDHLCIHCGGRILKCVKGNGVTPGGNPVHRCADCGKSSTDMMGRNICWCGYSHKLNNTRAYRCLPFTIIKEYPKMEGAFRECGCDPTRGEVGIVLFTTYTKVMNEAAGSGRNEDQE